MESLEFLTKVFTTLRCLTSHKKARVACRGYGPTMVADVPSLVVVVVVECARCHMTQPPKRAEFWQCDGTVRNTQRCVLVYPRHRFAKARHLAVKHLSWH